MFLGVTSVAFFATGVQSAVTSYTVCSYSTEDDTCDGNEVGVCPDLCSSTGTVNMCPHYTCDCLADVMDVTFGECILVVEGMGQIWTCIEDGADPVPYQNHNICPTVASTSEPEHEPEPEPSDDSPSPEPEHESDDGLTPEPEPEPSDDGPTPEPSPPCENSALCFTYCPSGDGTCTADSCTTTGEDWEDGFANCTGYYKYLSGMFAQFQEWGRCFDLAGNDALVTCNRDTPCENYDLCVTRCAWGEGDGTCSGNKCYTQGWNLDGLDNCDGFYTEISGMFSEFEEWGKCFTSDGRDHILTCNVYSETSSDVGSETSSNVGSETSSNVGSETSSSSEADIGMIIGIVVSAVVLITTIVCWVVYKRSLKTLTL